MIEGKMIQLAGRRAAYLVGIAAIGLSLTAAHPGSHDAPRTPSTKHLPAGTPLVHWRCWRKTL